MKVETFEVSEVVEASIQMETEAVELIEALGLEGQKTLVVQDESATKTRIPYRLMTADEQFVYGTICDQVTPVSKFHSSPIPLRVLQVLAHAKECPVFKSFAIWHPSDAKLPDPILVGYDSINSYDNLSPSGKPYYLARWGETLEEFPVLQKLARAMRKTQLLTKFKEIMSEASQKIAFIESLNESNDVESIRQPSFYC